MLCDLLTASGAKRPQSWSRREDIGHWARIWSVPLAQVHPASDRACLAAMVRAGSADSDLFGLRLMWDSVAEASHRLDAALGGRGNLAARIEQAFGPTLFAHLSREDEAAEATSLPRSERTGSWRLPVDGSERDGPRRRGWWSRTRALSGCVESWRGRMRRGPASSARAGSRRGG